MAEIRIEGEEVVLDLSRLEEVEGIHGDLRAALSCVQRVEVLDDPIDAIGGVRAPGTGIPGVLAIGTYRGLGVKTFAVVHHNTHRGVRVSFTGADYDEWVVGCADPEAVAATVSAHR